jgi:GDP-fucose transporter C1
MHSVVIKKSLDVVKGSALHLSWYTNFLSAIILVPGFVLMGELPAVMKLLFHPELELGILAPDAGLGKLRTFLWGSLITGVIGFLMSLASLLSIKVTSPITHMISSAVRGVAGALLGAWLFHDILSTGRTSSIGIILLGSIYYTWVKHVETQEAKAALPAYEQVPLEDAEVGQAPSNLNTGTGKPNPE